MAILTEEDPDREIMKVWKDYTTEDATVVKFLKSHENHQVQNSKFLLEKTIQILCMTSQDLQKSQSRKSLENLVAMAKMVWVKGFQDMNLGEIQEIIDNAL